MANSDILSRLKAAHDKRAMVRVPVPEYGLDLYFPPLTIADRHRIRQGINPKDEDALMVSALIHHARDANGDPVFPDSPAMRVELHKMDYAVLIRIMAQSAAAPLPAEAEGALAEVDLAAAREALASAVGAGPVADALRAGDDVALSTFLRSAVADHGEDEPIKNG